ncbi:N-acetylgalactosamine-specific PTS system, EIID component [Proteus mirabilis]|uniref:N-acetylgalactosamine-specific PTS system, EIID component n=1 Tax=Proteus mirabilis TaxID=584 RepID=A0A379GEJ5_PROMI|nr:N-acetylgalactosamine-specific PTS system, EIID component [Proteus mirabilis]
MTLMPLTLALGASIAMEGSIAGPFVFFFLYQIVHFLVYFGTDVYGLSRRYCGNGQYERCH